MKPRLDEKIPAVTECFVSHRHGPGPLNSLLVTELGQDGVGEAASSADILEHVDELAVADH